MILNRRSHSWVLYGMVLLIATAGLVYELIAGAVASYVLGDSVTQFSLVIGLYLSALGVGAYLSSYIESDVAHRFIDIELSTALVGGASAPLLLYAFAHTGWFHLVLWAVVLLTGTLVGLELPLLMRLLREQVAFKDLIAKALFFDYFGALIASILFALIFVPVLGLIRTSLIFGLLNAFVGFGSTWVLETDRPHALKGSRRRALVVIALLVMLLTQAERITKATEASLYSDPIVYAKQSAYQRIVVTQGAKTGLALYLNNNLQFSTTDEFRYHESLVHPAFALIPLGQARHVLIAGGGDGLALREVLRYAEVEHVRLVDLDRAMTDLGRFHPLLRKQNGAAFEAARVEVTNEDALVYLAHSDDLFDLIVIDFPDPNNLALGKLYTKEFYKTATKHLSTQGVMVVQATSPFFSQRSFWTIVHTIASTGFFTQPYHAFIPSFGEWGFVLVRKEAFTPPHELRTSGLRYLNSEQLAGFFHFPPDMDSVQTAINHLESQVLVQTYEQEMARFSY